MEIDRKDIEIHLLKRRISRLKKRVSELECKNSMLGCVIRDGLGKAYCTFGLWAYIALDIYLTDVEHPDHIYLSDELKKELEEGRKLYEEDMRL